MKEAERLQLVRNKGKRGALRLEGRCAHEFAALSARDRLLERGHGVMAARIVHADDQARSRSGGGGFVPGKTCARLGWIRNASAERKGNENQGQGGSRLLQ